MFTNNVVIRDPLTGEAKEQPTLKGGFTTGDYLLRYYAVNGTPIFRETHNREENKQTKPLGEAMPEGIPTIKLRPSEVVRVRMLNGCSDLAMPLALPGMDIHLIALDGNNFAAPRTLRTVEPAEGVSWDGVTTYGTDATTLVLGPGNRAEFLLQGEKPGTYELVQVFHTGVQFLQADRKVIARFVVEGEPLAMALPTQLPVPHRTRSLIQESELVGRREVRFGANFPAKENKVVGIDFMMNDAPYDHHRVDAAVKLNTAEAWTLVGHSHDGSEGHPFHIHVNPFELKTIGGRVQPPGTFLDTVWVPINSKAEIWMRFLGWTGKTVYHCHILPHEDTGMMHNLLIKA
jgi:FtsP/CotA-like multicopper oxidase with cupredoxin domain